MYKIGLNFINILRKIWNLQVSYTPATLQPVLPTFIGILLNCPIPVLTGTLLSVNVTTTFPALAVNTHRSFEMFKISVSMIFRGFGYQWM